MTTHKHPWTQRTIISETTLINEGTPESDYYHDEIAHDRRRLARMDELGYNDDLSLPAFFAGTEA